MYTHMPNILKQWAYGHTLSLHICLHRFILKISNTNRGHYKNECAPLLKHAVSEIMLPKVVMFIINA